MSTWKPPTVTRCETTPHSHIPNISDTKERQIWMQVSSSFLWAVFEPGFLSGKEPSVSEQYNG